MTTIILKPNWNIDSIFFHSAGIKYMHVKKVLDNIKKEQHNSATPSTFYLYSCLNSNILHLHASPPMQTTKAMYKLYSSWI